MIVKNIRGYGDLNYDIKKGSVHQLDFIIYFILRSGKFTDENGWLWQVHANVNEEMYVSCYEDGQQHSCKTIEELVETLKLLIEGSL